MNLKEIAKNSVWFGIIPKLASIATLFITPLITPFLTAKDYGIYGIITSYTGIIGGFAILGLHVHLANSYYEYKSRFGAVWRRLIFWMFIGNLLSFIVSAVVLWFYLPSVFPWSRGLVIFLSTFYMLYSFNMVVVNHYYSIRLIPKPLILKNLSATLIGILINFVLIYYLRIGFMAFLISSFISNLFLFFIFFKSFWVDLKLYPLPNKPDKRVVNWFKVALPMLPHQIGGTILASVDRIIMTILALSTVEIGIYSQGYSMGNYANVFIVSLITSIAPVIQTTFRNNNLLQMRKMLYFSMGITLLIITALSIWMKEIYFLLVRNPDLQICQDVASYTCFSYAMFPFYSMLSAFCFIEKKTIYVLWLVFIPAILNIILNFIFIPYYGYMAAAISTIASYWSIAIIVLIIPYFKNHIIRWFGTLYIPIFLLSTCIFLLVISHFIGNFELLHKVIITILVLLIFAIYYYFNKDKVKLFGFQHQDVL